MLQGKQSLSTCWLLVLSHTTIVVLFYWLGTQLGTLLDPTVCDNDAIVSSRTDSPPVRTYAIPQPWNIPYGLSGLFGGAARVSRQDFLDTFDTGLPYDDDEDGNAEVLILYDKATTLPSRYEEDGNEMMLYKDAHEATEHCNILRIVHVDMNDDDDHPTVCLALQGQASDPHYHIHKWIRQPVDPNNNSSHGVYQAVGRYHGLDPSRQRIVATSLLADPPLPSTVTISNQLLQHYLRVHQTVKVPLADVVKQAAQHLDEYLRKNNKTPTVADSTQSLPTNKHPTVVVLVGSKQQLAWLMNLVCAVRKSGTAEVRHYLYFAMDETSFRASRELGLTAFYHPRLFEKLSDLDTSPAVRVMMAKLYVTHLVSLLRYNMVFHDLTIVPYQQDYLQHFIETIPAKYPDRDIYFSYDRSDSPDYQPWFANSGFFLTRYNERTAYFFSYLLRHGDVVMQTRSHQAVLNMVLSDVSNQYGLYVKVLKRESNEYPVEYNYHNDPVYMKSMMKGKLVPKAFHMNWNDSEEIKHKFVQQMGAWHVQSGWMPESTQFHAATVCVDPVPQCHYRNKPSILTTCVH